MPHWFYFQFTTLLLSVSVCGTGWVAVLNTISCHSWPSSHLQLFILGLQQHEHARSTPDIRQVVQTAQASWNACCCCMQLVLLFITEQSLLASASKTRYFLMGHDELGVWQGHFVCGETTKKTCDKIIKCVMRPLSVQCLISFTFVIGLWLHLYGMWLCFSFAMWNTMMGTSLLSMPWAIEQVGALALYLSPKAAPDNK